MKGLVLLLVAGMAGATVPIVFSQGPASTSITFDVFNTPLGSLPYTTPDASWAAAGFVNGTENAAINPTTGIYYCLTGAAAPYTLMSLNPATGAQAAVIASSALWASTPYSFLAIDSAGNFYGPDNATNLSILEYTSTGGGPTTLVTLSAFPEAGGFNGAGQLIVVTHGNPRQMLSINPSTAAVTVLNAAMTRTVAGSILSGTGMAFDAMGNIYVSAIAGIHGYYVSKYSSAGAELNVSFASFTSPAYNLGGGLAFDPASGYLVVGGATSLVNFTAAITTSGAVTNPFYNASTPNIRAFAGPPAPSTGTPSPIRIFTLGPTLIH